MNAWVYAGLAFMTGVVSGAVFAYVRLKARISFYRRFIEDRSHRVNLPTVLFRAGHAR